MSNLIYRMNWGNLLKVGPCSKANSWRFHLGWKGKGTQSYPDGPFVQHSLPQPFGVCYKVFSPGSLRWGGLREVWVLERERYWLQVKQLFVCTTRGINKSGFAHWTFAYTICVLWKNHLIVLLLQGCENTGSASLCFKQHRNECEIRKSTSSFLQSVCYLNRQLWVWGRNGEVEFHGQETRLDGQKAPREAG